MKMKELGLKGGAGTLNPTLWKHNCVLHLKIVVWIKIPQRNRGDKCKRFLRSVSCPREDHNL